MKTTLALLLMCGVVRGQLIETPPVLLSDDGYNLIVTYEVGNEDDYNNSERFPTWPGGASGVTIGCGVDLGYELQSRIHHDWVGRISFDNVVRLEAVAGLTGPQARAVLDNVRDIEVIWPVAIAEFKDVEVANEYALTKRTFPGMENLRLNAQSALVATIYNRGSGMAGDSRADMRKLRALVPSADYAGMADALRHIPVTMYGPWSHAGIFNGLRARYNATAVLMETP